MAQEVRKIMAVDSFHTAAFPPVKTGALQINGQQPGLYIDPEQALVYSIHIREVLDAVTMKFEKPPGDSVEMLLYMAMKDLLTLSHYIDQVVINGGKNGGAKGAENNDDMAKGRGANSGGDGRPPG